MKKILTGLGIIFYCSTLVTSCSNDCEEYQEKLEECFKEKQEKLATEYATMDEAIDAYEFDIAHKFYSCYQQLDRLPCSGDKRIPKRRLAKAEITYLTRSNAFGRALQVYEEVYDLERVSELSMVPDKMKNFEGRYQIYYKAVYHYLEEGDRSEATKWAKRAPSNISVDGKYLDSWSNKDLRDDFGSKPPSQMEVLLEEIEKY